MSVDFLTAHKLLKGAKRTYVSVCKVFEFPARPLWRVIERGSGVRWMCNCISRSFSFFPSSSSRHLVFLVTTALSSSLHSHRSCGNWPPACRPVRIITTFKQAVLEGCTNMQMWMCSVWLCMCCALDIEYRDRLSWQHLLSAPWTTDIFFFFLAFLTTLFKSAQPLHNGKWHCSHTHWLLDTDLMACKFCFVG